MKITKLIPENLKPVLKKALNVLLTRSLQKAAKKQGLYDLIMKLEKIVPDISQQYSSTKLETEYQITKVRNQHAFQISLVNKIIEDIGEASIVDIGDSAGTHLQYLIGLHSYNKNFKTMSVNLDARAVEKIKQKGLQAIEARAEGLEGYGFNANIFLCFELLEHLMDPCHFLHELSLKSKVEYLIVTVPYLKISRIGLKHIKGGGKEIVNAENTHILELSPEDWKLLIMHSGWNVLYEEIYFQYPKRHVLRLTKILWRKFDFEGFYGLILRRDHTWSSRYQDW